MDEVINLEEVAYVTKRTAQKSQVDNTEIAVVTVLLKSGSPINMPFETPAIAEKVHSRISSELGAVIMQLPKMAKA